MTPGAQVAAAIDILDAIDAKAARPTMPPPIISGAGAISAPRTGRRIAGHVYAVLRHRAALDWWIARLGTEERCRSARAAGCSPAWCWPRWRPEAVAACCDGDRFRPAPLDADEERLVRGLAWRTLRHPAMPRAVANDMPDWLEPYLDRAFGKSLEREMAALNAPAPIDLRVNC